MQFYKFLSSVNIVLVTVLSLRYIKIKLDRDNLQFLKPYIINQKTKTKKKEQRISINN